jgi:predicted phage gp36 major capsid-like protein
MKRLAAFVLVLALFACSGQGSETKRIDALEAEVKALRQEAGERDEAFRTELARVRENLEHIRSMLEAGAASDKPAGEAGSAPTDKELDDKAKSFVDENLDRLMELTRKLLDKMESELGDKSRTTEEPPVKGDQI